MSERMTTRLSWAQVNAWRLTHQHLAVRACHADRLKVVTEIGGLHAQLMTSAELSFWARVEGLGRADVQEMLWSERTLVKTWAMRGTLHLIPAADFPLYVGARMATLPRRPPSWYSYHGVSPAEENAILVAVPAVLTAIPQTREELADAVVRETGNPNLRERLLSGWGALLKPSAFRGDLCFGPNRGQNVTFVRPDLWLGPWQAVKPEQALQTIARRFLTVYGPATIDEFARWWGMDESKARKLFKTMGDELSQVEVEGWHACVLTSTMKLMQTISAPPTVRLLPHFDPYTVSVARHCDYLLPPTQKGSVYRPQGWISPVVLVDGRIAGLWERNVRGATVPAEVTLFAPESAEVNHAVEKEITRLNRRLSGGEISSDLSD